MQTYSIVNFDGREYKKFLKPEGTQEWQTPNWSLHPDYATASAMGPEGNWDIYIVRLTTDERLRLTWDGGYVHAHMWVGPEVSVKDHSALPVSLQRMFNKN